MGWPFWYHIAQAALTNIIIKHLGPALRSEWRACCTTSWNRNPADKDTDIETLLRFVCLFVSKNNTKKNACMSKNIHPTVKLNLAKWWIETVTIQFIAFYLLNIASIVERFSPMIQCNPMWWSIKLNAYSFPLGPFSSASSCQHLPTHNSSHLTLD